MGKKRAKSKRKLTPNKGLKRVEKQPAKRAVRRVRNERKSRSTQELKKFPATQGIVENGQEKGPVGYKHPPVEHQFKPGESGNPAGSVKGQTHIRTYICEYMAMTPAALSAVKRRTDLTHAQKVAIKAVEQIVRQGLAGVKWLAIRELMHYDEGKPTEHVHIDREQELTEEECEEIREAIRKRT